MTALIKPENDEWGSLENLFFDRACILAQRSREGGLPFIDAIDMAYSAAEWSGLVDRLGDDAVQELMAKAFMGCHHR